MIETQDLECAPQEHLVQFYEHDAELAETVGRYLAEALEVGGSAIVIATESHRRAFEAELQRAGFDAAHALTDHTLVSLDAAEVMASFMPDGRIDPEAFRRVMGSILHETAQTASPVRAYGEMVALLWEDGDVLATIELEELWNELGRELPFSLLCAYHSSLVSNPEQADALKQVCHLHSSVLQAPRDEGPHADRPRPDRPHPRTEALSRQFPAEPDAPRAARRFVAEALGQWGRNGTLLQDAQLVISELATNAVVHAASPFTVVARLQDASVRLSVHDRSPEQPVVRANGSLLPSGRGLHLIAALASRWGVQTTGEGKAVWAELRA
jgi:anti-sigma regulatory factor (Ser/Thr protein kinase)